MPGNMNGYGRYNDYDPYVRGGGGRRGEDPYARGPPRVAEDPYGRFPPPRDDGYRAPPKEDPYVRRDEAPHRGTILFNTDYDHGIDYEEFVGRYQGSLLKNRQNGGPRGSGGEDHYLVRGQNGREEIYSRPTRDRNGAGPVAEPLPGDGTYNLDHLATFTVGPKQGLLTPSDGIQKLRQMETTSGIWTMRVKLVMDRNDVLIIDKQTGEEMERFPLNLLTDITAVTNRDRRDVYNNVLLFTVMQDSYKRSPTEMHLFHVHSVSAQEVVDSVKAAQRGSGRANQYSAPPREQVQSQVREFELHAEKAAQAYDAYRPGPRPRDALGRSMRRPDDNDTVVSERTDRDVQLLNHCFDDIERFVGRLQHAAEAFKELDRRRRGRENKKSGRGDGMLSMRARPPPGKDFIDIFQKFKLSFNLLAKLKPHIHDPNAPELVHFLFTPLSLVVEASKDPRHGTPDLASKVVAPLLTPEAKELLLNCLTSKEADLWMSLGDTWKLSRDEWKSYVPPYYPRFSDGWQPQGMEDEYRRDDRPPARQENPYPTHDSHYREHPSAAREPPPPARDREREAAPRRDDYEAEQRRAREQREREELQREREMREAREREAREEREAKERELRERQQLQQNGAGSSASQQAFLREIQSRGALAYEAIHNRDASNEKEITLRKGDIVEVVDKRRNWWKVRNSRGEVGHAPFTILQQADVRR